MAHFVPLYRHEICQKIYTAVFSGNNHTHGKYVNWDYFYSLGNSINALISVIWVICLLEFNNPCRKRLTLVQVFGVGWEQKGVGSIFSEIRPLQNRMTRRQGILEILYFITTNIQLCNVNMKLLNIHYNVPN